jgi:hypothetical protein
MGGADSTVLSQIVLRLVADAPAVAADIIALAAGEPEANQQARTLPFTLQVSMLNAIGRMTFEAGGGLGNFLAELRGIATGLGLKMPTKDSTSSVLPTASAS